jgi:hypothetical protein
MILTNSSKYPGNSGIFDRQIALTYLETLMLTTNPLAYERMVDWINVLIQIKLMFFQHFQPDCIDLGVEDVAKVDSMLLSTLECASEDVLNRYDDLLRCRFSLDLIRKFLSAG